MQRLFSRTEWARGSPARQSVQLNGLLSQAYGKFFCRKFCQSTKRTNTPAEQCGVCFRIQGQQSDVQVLQLCRFVPAFENGDAGPSPRGANRGVRIRSNSDMGNGAQRRSMILKTSSQFWCRSKQAVEPFDVQHDGSGSGVFHTWRECAREIQ